MEHVVLALHVVISLVLIALILIQQGKGADAGASFGSGASQTIFGSQGSGNFLTKITALFVTLFFTTSLVLGYLMVQQTKPRDLDDLLKQAPQTEITQGKTSDTSTRTADDIPELLQ